jgi:hypothetical protein
VGRTAVGASRKAEGIGKFRRNGENWMNSRVGHRYFTDGAREAIFATAVFAASLLAPLVVSAQSSHQLYVYPLKKQSAAQQDRDRYECHRWAVGQTGFDPSATYPDDPSYLDPQPYRPTQPHVLRGAGRGAALGVVGGAITGNAGKGAAAGAAMGGLAGGFRRRDEKRQYETQRRSDASSAQAKRQANYTRAMAACLEGRGYSVK